MRKFRKILLFLLCMALCLPLCVNAETSSGDGCIGLQARRALQESYDGTAGAAVLYETDSETLVCAYEADRKINPTGMVKIMTALVALEQGNLDDMVTVKQSTINSVPASAKRLGLKSGDTLTVRDLLYCVMLASSNDAAAVLAEHVAGTQTAFVEKMNERAATIGCTSTLFTDVNGLNDDTQYSTARELAMIAAEAMKNDTFAEMFGAVNYRLPSTVSCKQELTTNNALLNEKSTSYDKRVTGGRPAAASGSDRSIICTAENENGRYLCVLISVADKSTSYAGTFREAKSLLALGLDGYALRQVFGADQPVTLYDVTNGENSVVVGANREIFALLPLEFEQEKLRLEAVPNEQALVAPLQAGTEVGTLRVLYGDVVVAQVSLLARHDVAVRGTTVQEVPRTSQSLLWRIVKWALIVLVCAVVLTASGLLIVRRVNIIRYRKRKKYRKSAQREESR